MTLKQWQKIYPDAVQIKATTRGFIPDEEMIESVYGIGAKSVVLQNSSWLGAALKKRYHIDVITSVLAGTSMAKHSCENP